MKKSDVLKYYGGTKLAAAAANVSGPAVSQWGEIIPQLKAELLARKTKGKRRNGVVLRYRPSQYENKAA